MDLKELQKNWDAWGKLDPLWAILSLPGKEGSRWDKKEFFETGEEEIDQILHYVQSLGVTLSHRQAMDFGCGAGRLAQAFVQTF